MFSQVLAPYCLAADFVMRLQRNMLVQGLNDWSDAMAAAVGRGSTERVQVDEREPFTRNGRGEGVDGQPAAPSRTAGSGRESYNIAVEESILRRAYFKWVDEGYPDGQHIRHYFDALHEVRG